MNFETRSEILTGQKAYLELWGKEYSDKKYKAKECEIRVGDTVLVRQQKENKMSTNFGKDLRTVVERNGNSILLDNGMKRNSTFVKKFVEKDPPTNNTNIESMIEPPSSESGLEEHEECTSIQDPLELENDRPRRSAKMPSRFKDFIVG